MMSPFPSEDELQKELLNCEIEYAKANFALVTHKGNVGEIEARRWARRSWRALQRARRRLRRRYGRDNRI